MWSSPAYQAEDLETAGPAGPQPVLDLWASREVTVSGEDQDGLMLTLQPGMTVSGRVRCLGSTKPPEDLTRVLINLAPANHDPGVAMSSQEPVSAAGTFALSGITPEHKDLPRSVHGCLAVQVGTIGTSSTPCCALLPSDSLLERHQEREIGIRDGQARQEILFDQPRPLDLSVVAIEVREELLIAHPVER